MKSLSSTLRSSALPFLVFVVGLGVTQFVAWRVKQLAELRALMQFENTTAQLTQAIAARVDIYISLLRGTSGVLRKPETRNVADFADYVAALRLPDHYPGIQGVGFAEYTEFGSGTEYVPYRRQAGDPPVVWPNQENGIGFPIVLLEPADPRNRRAIGFDMYSEPVRRAAMDQAWQTGRPAVSGKVTLVQEIDEQKQAGFLIYLPIYESNGEDDLSPEPPPLLGFAFSPFRADDLFAGIFAHQERETLRVEIFDGPAPRPRALLHTSSPDGASSAIGRHVLVRQLEIGGRTWTVRFVGGADTSRSTWLAVGVSTLGASLTALLALLIRNLERNRSASDAYAQQLQLSEQAAKDNERLKQAILDAALDGVVTIDHRGAIVEYNPAAERMFGYDRDEALGQNLLNLILPPRALDNSHQELQRELTSGAGTWVGQRLEVTAKRADGELFPIEVAIARVELHGQPLFTAYLRDITQRRRAEAQLSEFSASLERRVQQRTAELQDANQQLESFSYSVSHDLRAPARHVLGFSELLQRQLAGWSDPSAQRLVRVITDSARRMAQLIDDLLAFSRTSRQEFRRGPVAMDELVMDVRRRLAPEMVNRHIEWEVSPLPVVHGDRALLAQVWTNLIANAIKYTRRREVARIQIRAQVTDKEKIFEITDNGTGFDMAYADKLFGVFQRLHREEEFEGTGIGLANVARIIQRHGGHVWARGEPEAGASFFFALPRQETEHTPVIKKTPSGSPFEGPDEPASDSTLPAARSRAARRPAIKADGEFRDKDSP